MQITKMRLCVFCWITAAAAAALTLFSPAHVYADESNAGKSEQIPDGLQIKAIEVYPSKIELKHEFDYRQVIVSGVLKSGEKIDLTRMAKSTFDDKICTVNKNGLVRPKGSGQTKVVFSLNGMTTELAVNVDESKGQYKSSFVGNIQPVLSKLGCNKGTCHGSKDGKNGFKLSLRGYDPLYDHRSLTDDVRSRRFNRAAPEQSLMLLKATGAIPHVGGQLVSEDDDYYKILRNWIANGARLDLNVPRVKSIQIVPENPIVPRAGMKQQMAVLATYYDGAVRDVTREAFIESGDIERIAADKSGVLTMLRRGEAPVLVRYEGAYAATTITVIGDRSGFAWKEEPTNNYIDKLVNDKLKRVKILPSGLCTDEEFLRRIYLDLTGLPPTPKQILSFLADKRPQLEKRTAIINQLIGNREYVEHWSNKWADLLQVNRKFLGEEGSIALRNWIKQSVASNKPYNKFAYELITAKGSTIENPPAAYYKILRNPADLMENTTHLFLAVRFNCNKCHDHPFERWTQDQYYDLAAYFAQVGRKEDPLFRGKRIGGTAVEGAKPLVEVVYDTSSGDVKHGRTGSVVQPGFPYKNAGDKAAKTTSRREALAQWMTSPRNRYFAKSYVNRIWGYMFGRGIIEPIDDIRAGNPPTNPELLDALTKDFIDHDFDTQHIIQQICQSRTYQRSIATNKWNGDDEINYSHAIPRRLPAEVLYDAIHMAAGVDQRIPGVPVGFRAAQLPDVGVAVPFLDDFGRPVRESACECERSSGVVLGPVMKLINGPTVANAINSPNGRLAELANNEKDDDKLLDEMFLRFLGRKPTDKERKVGKEALSSAGEDYVKAKTELTEYERLTVTQRQAEWESELKRVTEWHVLKPVEAKSKGGAELKVLKDNSIFVSKPQETDTYDIVLPTNLKMITGLRLEAMADDKLPGKGPGLAQNGNFVVSEFRVKVSMMDTPSKTEVVELKNADADFSQNNYVARSAIDTNEKTGWAVSPQIGKTHTATFETAKDIKSPKEATLSVSISQQHGGKHVLGRFRVSATGSPRPFVTKTLPDKLREAMAVAPEKRNKEQKAVVREHYRKTDRKLQLLEEALARREEERKNLRLIGVQDLAWALINNPAFLFNY